MSKLSKQFFLVLTVLSLFACNSQQREVEDKDTSSAEGDGMDHNEGESEQLSAEAIEKDGITVSPANIAKTYPNASLKLTNSAADFTKAGAHRFDFEVENYELAIQTAGAKERHCANSSMGQHIHFILNNAPYQAKYEPSFEAELLEGNNVVLAFLSRSYHESIKNNTAFVFENIQIGDGVGDFDMNAQHLFYSRPKGNYSGKDAQKILFDFYLINTALAEDGNHVRLTIDDIEFTIDSWQPYFVEGLSIGSHRFRIELIDQSGNLIEGPFNDSGEREITIGEPS